jgi:hypothetical protein
MARKRKLDPETARLQESLERERSTWERWWRRHARAFRALLKCEARIKRLIRRLNAVDRDGA